MIRDDAAIEITGYRWVPPFARGFVRDLRPRWACEEAGVGYRERLIDVINKPAGFTDEQPWGQVPVMRDGTVQVFESGAALLHLGLGNAALLPVDAQARATAMSWLMGAFNSVEPALFEFTNVTVFSKDEDWARLRRPSLEEWIGRRIAPFEVRLAQQDWLGDSFSIADIAMITVLRTLGGSALMDKHPSVAGYIARAEARPAFQRAMADQLAAFDRHPDNQA